MAIVIYSNTKSNKKINIHTENIIQLYGGATPLDVIINYCINIDPQTRTSVVVIHHHKPIKIKNYILGRSRNQKLMSGFYVFMLPAHTILINKDTYIVDELLTYHQECQKGTYLTKIRVSDIYFPNIQRTLYITTMNFKESYFDQSTYSSVASFFEFLHKEPPEPFPIIIADFACQNWNYLNRDWKFSSGQFNIPTYVDDRGCVARNGFIFNNLKGTIHVEQILDVNIESELMFRLTVQNCEDKTMSIQLAPDTEKTAMSIKYRDTVNFVKSKLIPDKHNIVITEFIEYTYKPTFKIVPIEDIINTIIKAKK